MLRSKIISVILIITCFHFYVNAQVKQYQIPANAKYVPSTLIIKFKSLDQGTFIPSSKILRPEELINRISIKSKKSIRYGNTNENARGLKSKFLSDIYRITINEGENLSVVLNELLAYENVIYAEPLFYEQLLFEPNDTELASQDHLAVIKAYEAWDVTLGSTDVVVGIIDTGMQLDHEDLQNQLSVNKSEEVNGIDDDENGLIDDINGWDFADNDNDPTADKDTHGTRVAGISSARTNNGIGVAGVGYTSKVVPLKIFRSSNNRSSNSYNAIIYAADQGYDVINLSWGSVGSFSKFNQDVINYAAIEKNVVIVAAAGNTNADLNFYPASYDNVLSVAASDINDNRAPFATYSYKVDIMAPGAFVFSTVNGNTYGADGGSSFSAPQVAGAAALVRAVFPNLNALQVMQQLRVTADDVYEVGDNSDYIGQLGKGRLNVLRAVTESTSPSIRIDSLTFSGIFGEQVFFDDSVTVKMNFTNYLRTTSNAKVSISSNSSHISFSTSDFNLGDLGELESVKNFEIKFYVKPSAPAGERIAFRLDFTDESGYSDFEYFVIELEKDYLTIDNNKLSFTIASNGNLGYAEGNLQGGSGFQFEGEKIADHLGIIIGNHADSVSNNVFNNFTTQLRDTSFQNNSVLKLTQYDSADYYAKSDFEDTNENDFGLGLHLEQEILAWNDSENQDYLVLEYRLSNNSLKQKSNLSFGFYADWNLADDFQNKAAWDASNKMAYVYDGLSSNQFAGLALLTDQSASHHGVEVRSENGNVAEFDNEFTKSNKFDFMSNPKLTAGDIGSGNDVANLLTANIGTMQVGSSQKLSFVLTSGNTLEALQNNVTKAKNKYAAFLASPPITHRDTTCFNENLVLKIPSGINFEIYNDPQMSELLLSGNDFNIGPFEKDTILYYRNIDGKFASDISGLELYVSKPSPNFTLSTDTLYLGNDALNQVQFTDTSGDAVSWEWSFGNGAMASIQNPKIAFSKVGAYQINLTMTTSLGCTASKSKDLLVAVRSAIPTINDQTICKSESTSISSSDVIKLRFYINELDIKPVFEGAEFTTGVIVKDTTFFVSSVQDIFESHKVPVKIIIDNISADFRVKLDTLDLGIKNLLSFENKSTNATSSEWFVDELSIGTTANETFAFDTQNSLNIKLSVLSALNCSDAKTQVIDLTTSIKPQIPDTIFVCKFDSTIIIDNNGGALYFYNDRNMTSLTHKGISLKSGELLQDRIVYYTGVSSYRESSLDSVLLHVIPFETEIIASPETLVLTNGRNVTFTASNSDAINWRWYIQNELIETVENPVLRFDTAGIYQMKLIVKNLEGCTDTTSLEYEVKLITKLNDDISADILIYPNPAVSQFSIEHKSGGSIENIKLFNTLGKNVQVNRKSNSNTYNVSNLPNGIYFVLGTLNNSNFSRRIVVRK